jgi:cell division protein FtsL
MGNLARQLERKRIADIPDHQRQVQQEISKKLRITPGEKFLYLTTLIGVVFATYFIISMYASIYIVNKDIHSLESSISAQMLNNEALQLQVTELSDPNRILQIATNQLGMTLNDKNVKVIQN